MPDEYWSTFKQNCKDVSDDLQVATQMELIGFLKSFFFPNVPGRFFPIPNYTTLSGKKNFKTESYQTLAELNSLLLFPSFPITTAG